MTDQADVVVVGGGCHGTSIAWQLARGGAGRVVLVEKQAISSGATGVSSAIVRLHYSHETLARMAMFGRRMFERFDEEVGGSCGFRRTGFLNLLAEGELTHAGEIVDMQRRIGIDASLLTPDEAGRIEPRISLDGVAGATWEPDSGHADGASTAGAFANAAHRAGAELRIGDEVTALVADRVGIARVDTVDGTIQTRTVVVAAGYRTAALLAPLGVDLPLTPVRHTIALVDRTGGFGEIHPVVADRPQGSYYRSEGSGISLIGAVDPLEGDVDSDVETARRPSETHIRWLAERFWKRFSSQAEARLRPGYTGVYDCTPDFQPALGPVAAVPGLYVAAGFSGHGFKLSPAVGRLMAETILEGNTPFVDIGMFRFERFADGELITSPGGYAARTLA